MLNAVEFVELYKQCGSVNAVQKYTEQSRRQVQNAYHEALRQGLMVPVGNKKREDVKTPLPPQGKLKATATRAATLPPRNVINRYIFTSAQNDTLLHDQFWTNLLKFADFYDAQIHVSRFVYMKTGLNQAQDKAAAFDQVNDAKRDKGKNSVATWDPRLTPYLSDYRMEVAPGLVWCGEMNILPTAVRPLSGLEVYTGRRSGIFPHVKIALESIASMRDDPTKFNFTTGTVTQRNYIQRKAGLKAEFHHCYGALLVEVDFEGNWFCRQISADSEGTFYDLDVMVQDGFVSQGHNLEAINWGDVHVAEIDETIKKLYWGHGGVLDTMKPKYQFLHDVITFRGRSHHEVKDPYIMFRRYLSGEENIANEVDGVGLFLAEALRPWCESVIVDSNHHRHMGRWLKEQDGRFDPVNAVFWAEMQSRVFDYMNFNEGEEPLYLKEALTQEGFTAAALGTWLQRDESFIICEDAHGGIECGEHGDDGPNGSRGSTKAYARMGRRINKQHDHQAAIIDGSYSAGTCGVLQPDWTFGPSSWSHSMIFTYKSGKRAVVTSWKGKWRA